MDIESLFFETTDFELQNTKIGEGAFGTVYISTNKKDGKQYATFLEFVISDYLEVFLNRSQNLLN